MEIIRKGCVKPIPYQFTCPVCNTIYKCSEGEYKTSWHHPQLKNSKGVDIPAICLAAALCPTCGSVNYTTFFQGADI